MNFSTKTHGGKKTISFGLSVKEIEKARAALRKERDLLSKKCDEFARRCAEFGLLTLRTRIAEYGAVDTRALLNSAYAEPVENGVWCVYMGAYYAVYVEYGTGQVGKENPHPDPQGWSYDVNNHGDAGWDYIKGGKKYHTRGQPARPYFHDSFAELAQQAQTIAKEVFKFD